MNESEAKCPRCGSADAPKEVAPGGEAGAPMTWQQLGLADENNNVSVPKQYCAVRHNDNRDKELHSATAFPDCHSEAGAQPAADKALRLTEKD